MVQNVRGDETTGSLEVEGPLSSAALQRWHRQVIPERGQVKGMQRESRPLAVALKTALLCAARLHGAAWA